MKRYLVDNSGYIHMSLFFIWFLVMISAFCCGSELFNEAAWIPAMGVIALLLQVVFGVVEYDWVQEIRDDSGY